MKNTVLAIPVIALITLASCTGMKNITSEDPLYTGNKVQLSEKGKYQHQVVKRANEDIFPEPNNTFLWMRPALARYNMLSDSARQKKFWKKYIDQPVTLSDTDPPGMAELYENRLFHSGFFKNSVTYDTVWQSGRKAGYQFDIKLNDPDIFGRIQFPSPKDSLTHYLNASAEETLLQTGDHYSLQTLKDERIRIDRFLKMHGYIYFNPDFVGFRADTVTHDHNVDVEVYLKPDTPPESKSQFSVRKVYIFDDYYSGAATFDTLAFDPYYLITADSTIRPKALIRGIFIEPGETYNRNTRAQTTRYLNSLPIIRSATSGFVRTDDSTQLDAQLYINKYKRFAYSAEFNAIFRSTNYFGPGIIFSFTDRNARGSAQRFKVDLRGRFEIQIVDGVVNPAYELGVDINYLIPRLVPDILREFGRDKLPKTSISAGYNLFNRLDLYRLNSLYFNYGYRWQTSEKLRHSLNPVDIIFTVIPENSKSDEFEDYLDENPGVRRSFDEQFVVGFSYELIYDPPSRELGDFYLRAGFDLSGNLLSGIYSITGAERDTSGRYTLFDVPFSQFVRPTLDLSYKFNFNRRSNIVAHFAAGIGVPYGNSDILPYIRQFYVGGTNSLRSFVSRSIGPGGEVPPEGYTDLTGDLRLEFNLEYRFTIAGRLKGALFADTGNIWLYNEDESRPEGVFRFNTFTDQLALSAGWGLRWDFDFVVARLDFAYTIRTPYPVDGENWNQNIRIWKPTLNIAIGYPF